VKPIYVTQSGTGSSAWQTPSWQLTPINFGIACVVSGTINYSFEYTLEDQSNTYPNSGTDPTSRPVNTSPQVFAIAALASQTASISSSWTTPIAAWRITKNSGTGSVQAIVLQAGVIQ